ncbi:hypothetical protein EV127DRAFT_503192 [Xylaria flabelliformis]|nr:hypothetical protein EV127DRAFT_503192 [Xylaria flabelliformis]
MPSTIILEVLTSQPYLSCHLGSMPLSLSGSMPWGRAWTVMTPWVVRGDGNGLDPVDMSPWARVARLYCLSHCDEGCPVSRWVHVLDSIAMITRDVRAGLISHLSVLHTIMQKMRPRLLQGLSTGAASFIVFALQELAVLVGMIEIADSIQHWEESEQLFLKQLDSSIEARGRCSVGDICRDLSKNDNCVIKDNLVIFSDAISNAIVVDVLERTLLLVDSHYAAPIDDPYHITLLSPEPSRWPNKIFDLEPYDWRFRLFWERFHAEDSQEEASDPLHCSRGSDLEGITLALDRLQSKSSDETPTELLSRNSTAALPRYYQKVECYQVGDLTICSHIYSWSCDSFRLLLRDGKVVVEDIFAFVM